ncbi:hypothetical protein [Sphingomicrobium nitratireducens]|uniref:hypothetical protein n=1 Tax=Sphingomicrobium nitratireducens TaxID=2964666 RepID=UPI002240DD7C|nr:hypothetical protein [Sphingomicrobium nitratireducens]
MFSLITGIALMSSTIAAPDGPRPSGLVTGTRLASADAVPPVRRVIIRNQLILRIPLQPKKKTDASYRVLNAPKCFATRGIAGARLAGERTIDFLMRGNQRVRVQTDRDCKSLDFYGGFYLQPTDGQLCVGRDAVRTRMGGSCRIERVQLLQPLSK